MDYELDFEYPALPERVWAALTDPAKVRSWLGDAGSVVAVDKQQVVLELASGGQSARARLLVEPASGGSRLRVRHSGELWAAQIYEDLFARRLAQVLRGGLIAHILPRRGFGAAAPARTGPPAVVAPAVVPPAVVPPAVVPPAVVPPAVVPPAVVPPAVVPPAVVRPVVAVPAVAVPPAVVPAAVVPAAVVPSAVVPPVVVPRATVVPVAAPLRADRPQSTVRWPWMIVAVAALAAAGFGLYWFVGVAPSHTSAAHDPSTAVKDPAIRGGPHAVTPVGGPARSGALNSTVPVSGAMSAVPTSATADTATPLTVSYAVSARSVAGYSVTVSVYNPSGVAQDWSTVRVQYAGVNVAVSKVTPTVQHSGPGCFYPSASVRTVAAGVTFHFSFTVTAVAGTLLGDVRNVSLAACP
jgi:hypothetical protein